jgi:hypothetical protein
MPVTARLLLLGGLLASTCVSAFEFPTEREVSAERLLDIWHYQNSNIVADADAPVRILDFQRRFFAPVRGVSGLAYVRFEPLDASGDPAGWNKANCAGETLVGSGVQLVFYWGEAERRWLNWNSIGSSLCATKRELTQKEIEETLTVEDYPKPPKVAARDAVTPPRNSPERVAIMDAARTLFGKDASRIVFEVITLKVAAGFAWAVLMPRYKDGSRVGCLEGDDLQTEIWLKREDGRWVVKSGGACSGDPVAPLGETIGAPPELIGQTSWPWSPR